MDILFNPSILLRKPEIGPDGKSKQDPAALHKACQQFEAILLGSMFKEMQATVPTDGVADSGDDNAMQTYQSLMDQQVASQLAQTQSVGIADAIYRQLVPPGQKSEAQDPPSR
ncbi:MAG TPA: rod-binding protein [Desulfuromonadales bacterium]|nr:rod-binding protein [Desulfuromonadales bacterium]